MKLLKKMAIAFGLLTASAIGCNKYDYLCEEKLKERGFTQEQAEVLTAVSFPTLLADKVTDSEGHVKYDLNYGAITEEDELSMAKTTHDDLEEMLNPTKFGISDFKYFANSGWGKQIIKQEKVFNYHKDILTKKVLHRKFKTLMRETQDFRSYDPYKLNEDEKYSLATIFPFKQDNLKFEAKYVESARNEGKLQNQATAVEEITEQEKFFEKVRNPEYPVNDRNNKYIYKERKMGLKITSYNLDDDKEKTPDYIEAFRLKENGKPESLPAIRVFKPNGTGELEIILADEDFEGEPGYGIPDYLKQVVGVTGANDILSSEVADYIFKNMRKKDIAIPNLDNLNEVYIVRVGTVAAEKYDINPNGWESYLPDYKTGKKHKSADFIAHIKSKNKTSDEDEDISKVEWIAKRYFDKSRTVEFYRLNENFRTGYAFSSYVGSNKTMTLTDKNGQVQQYSIDAVIEKIPYRIDFDRNQQKRWILLDKDNDKKHYEAKKEVSVTSDIIPE